MAGRRLEGGHHQPVMAERVAELLITNAKGAYLDLTAGGGGHLLALAAHLDPSARLYGADVDPEAVARTERTLHGIVQFQGVIRTPFGDIDRAVRNLKEDRFDGILLDLGISSYQLDDPSRGISFRFDGPLDMRFDPGTGATAADLVNSLKQSELKKILKDFGEERLAARIAGAIVRERQRGMILTTAQLKDIVTSVVSPPHQTKALARVFQALRVAVNRELDQLSRVLPAALSLLKSSSRLAVISYHSLEDRIVKRFFQEQGRGVCTCPPQLSRCECGAAPSLKIITRRPLTPSETEVASNPRARSARLRVAEKLA
ncbi:MAG: 16S rRNA (cytosine(1402)-N(4))-methyltransferase RsmH [Candidatus Zixiibacteriota bacterium]